MDIILKRIPIDFEKLIKNSIFHVLDKDVIVATEGRERLRGDGKELSVDW